MKPDSNKIWVVIIKHPNTLRTVETNFYSTEKEAIKDAKAAEDYTVDMYHNGENIAYTDGDEPLQRVKVR